MTTQKLLMITAVLAASACALANPKGPDEMDHDTCTTAKSRSLAMIRAVLDDVSANYPHEGGGGITEIKQIATDSFMVSIAQEERIDLITYSLSVGESCKVSILEKKSDASSPWEE